MEIFSWHYQIVLWGREIRVLPSVCDDRVLASYKRNYMSCRNEKQSVMKVEQLWLHRPRLTHDYFHVSSWIRNRQGYTYKEPNMAVLWDHQVLEWEEL